ncbi:MAG: fused response regulator/phosphatase [Gammaproteobacteria bacterium]|jgi:DNA-binding response OmpR family regulator|uniref:fused response regulator/phosphatase n=1 Tax=Stutzerimonas TaxID=2901164 RepID=UPI000C9A22AA|nr:MULTISPECIES: fused response regulator/phosphatase [Stutzerimonas]MBU0810337.1 fused response regulator/phosphatase [Gammaproteobacteria bacterium]HAW23940.1 fused response regulator/phosphatase [Pseudomonas sp.]MBK3848366.1 SpoIIE family protein phosphatase [Stutzerimonas xanthomarina]MBU0852332.1 fused response regulator/phosphatase [Gammaproteobacteria bacterium]MBU1302725.1 fused response regulator/phosphatase [Gammaproteobacteria bacterium]|tara:strand:+ start:9816 stop:11519 length:1704 start_codon:yes stop_codon:yes gene_type:complete
MPGRLSILIAEDGAADRMLLAAIVRRQGHRVTTAANGAEAISLFERERPQLVLMDALMPVMDGFEAAQQIKRLAGNELVPIIFLTSLTENEALVRCLEAGGDDFIAKPYNPIILEAKIQAMHRLRRLQATVLEQRDLIGRRNQQLLDEQRAAKAIFDKVAHAGCLNAPNIRYRQSPRALFNGDLLLAAQAPAGRMFVLLGDFTGHGLPAAVGAMPLAETFYGMTAKGYSSNQILRDINAKLKLILPVEMFCCATFLDINLEQGILRVWNGGLPDGYLLKADGDWLPLRSRHLPLGVREASSFDDSFETLPLAMGDRLLLLSDGLLESRNADDQLFGEQRLLAVIEANRNPATLFDDIQEALQAFHGQILDDLSLVEVSMLAESEETAAHLSHVYPLGSRELRPRDWTTCFELRPDSLRTADPLPMTMQLLLQISPLRYRVGTIFTVLSELYSNAMEHGVLLLDSSIKSDAEGFASYYRERQRRLEALDEGFVSIELTVKSEGGSGYLRITVRDSGPGFDVQRALNQQYCSEQLGGRGLRMIRQLSERFYWQPDGKVLNVEFHWVGHA